MYLDKAELSGTYVSFGGGTGVFCFIDFVAFVLRYMCNKICVSQFNEMGNTINSEDFSMVKDNFNLIYFSTFADDESAVFHEICEELQELDKKYNLNVFKFYSRISSGDKIRWDKNFVVEKLGKLEEIKKIFICGPTRFLDDIKKSILESEIVGIEKIHLV